MFVETPITVHEHEHEADMPLFLNNDEIAELITMKDTMEALEILYREMGEGAAVTAPRSEGSHFSVRVISRDHSCA